MSATKTIKRVPSNPAKPKSVGSPRGSSRGKTHSIKPKNIKSTMSTNTDITSATGAESESEKPPPLQLQQSNPKELSHAPQEHQDEEKAISDNKLEPAASSQQSQLRDVQELPPTRTTSKLNKFRLLLWKNYVLQKRHKIQTVFEIFLPLFFISILLVVRTVVIPTKYPVMRFPSWSPDNVTSNVIEKYITSFNVSSGSPLPNVRSVSYAPNTSPFQEIMNNMRTIFLTFNMGTGIPAVQYNLRPFPSEQQVVNDYLGPSTRDLLCAVIFDSTTVGDTIKYSLRMPAVHEIVAGTSTSGGRQQPGSDLWHTNLMFAQFQRAGPRAFQDFQGGPPGYYSQGYTYLQFALEASIIKTVVPTVVIAGSQINNVNVKMQRFPHPPFIDDVYIVALQDQLPMMILLSFIYPFVNLTKALVVEKEKKLKVKVRWDDESMKMMGLPNYMHWSAWFIKDFLLLLVAVILMVTLLKIKVKNGVSVIQSTDATVLVVFLLAFTFASIMLAFLMSTLYSDANSASTGAGLMWFLLFFPHLFLSPRYDSLSQSVKISFSLLSNIAMSFGSQLIVKFEGTQGGSHWNNIGSQVTPDDELTVLHCIMMLIADGVIYFLLAMYIEGVMPGEFGVPLPWYFPFTKTYWCGYSKAPSIDNATDKSDNLLSKNNFEADPVNAKAGVRIQELSKTYGTKKAVRNLNLNMYENQITVLLGHNGAGKSTTMSMLTGLFPPTSGTAAINGFDIRTNINEVRSSLGLCPQHDVLFDELTCEEHLQFFCWMKGCVNVKEEIDHILTALNFEPKRHAQAGTLSGGMKRKLSVGIALCGGSRVVLLDEPTSGMDPGARRSTWDLLTSEKQNRTILLSTHFMDEADLLGDRIAIMAAGQLQTVGSSLFLKNRFGAGYHLVVVKKPGCDPSKITEAISKHLGEAKVEQDVGAELSYALAQGKSNLFANLFEEIEQRREELLIDSYGAGITTMEEVFMRVGQEVEERTGVSSAIAPDPNSEGVNNLYTNVQYNSGFTLDLQQFRAMLVKKTLHMKRNIILFIVQVLILPFFPLLNIVQNTTLPKARDNPSFMANLNKFPGTVTTLSCDQAIDPLCSAYEAFGIASRTQIQKTAAGQSLSNVILSEYQRSLQAVNLRYIVGMERSGNNVTAFFNNQPLHAQPIALNFVMNALFRQITSNPNKQIIASNHPLPYTPLDNIKNVEGGTRAVGFAIGFSVVFGMSFLVSSFVVFLIKERESKAKHLQFVSGVKCWIFWVANFIFDYLIYAISCVLVLVDLVAFQHDDDYSSLNRIDPLSSILVLFAFYGWAIMPLMYVCSFRFSVPAAGYTRMNMLNIFSGLAPLLAVTILRIPSIGLEKTADIVDWVFMFSPNYDLGYGISQISKNMLIHDNCKQIASTLNLQAFCVSASSSVCCTEYPYGLLSWHPPGIGRNLFFLFGIGLISIIGLMATEGKLQNLKCSSNNQLQPLEIEGGSEEDSDVADEAKRIRTTNLEDLFEYENLVVKDLAKSYGKFVAVQCLNLGVHKKECFGLLGVNGAGKTTTFKMLTGDLRASSGDAYICGKSINSQIKEVHKHLGYCPQFDAVIEEFTGRETIWLFARLRGIREDEIDDLANRLGDGLIFREHMEKPVYTYSGGNKRKLSTAVALVGNPPLVFLDEPSTGMDPVARRHLWNCISKVRDAGASIILTSHSMEECEALCSRLVVMVNGRFRCLGSIQHLKSKFGEGYTVIAQISTKAHHNRRSFQETQRRLVTGEAIPKVPWELEIEPLREFIEASFPGAVLKDVHPGYVHYHVQNPNLSWGAIFRKMEESKEIFKLEAYSVGQTSLEQVFLNFSKDQVAVE